MESSSIIQSFDKTHFALVVCRLEDTIPVWNDDYLMDFGRIFFMHFVWIINDGFSFRLRSNGLDEVGQK